jgi:hypothetical protein
MDGSYVQVHLTPDSRFVWSSSQRDSALADRATGKSYRWTGKGRLLIAVSAEALLWETLSEKGAQTGKFQLERPDGTLIKAFDVDTQNGDGTYLFKRLLGIIDGAFLVEKTGEKSLRVDTKTGETTEVPRPEFGHFYHAATGRQLSSEVYKNTIPIANVQVNGKPEYRVLAAYPSCGWSGVTSSPWRADGGGVALWTGEGPVMADLTGNKFESLAIPKESYWLDPAPSPSRNDRWGSLSNTADVVTLKSFGPGTTPVASGTITWDRQNLALDTTTAIWSADGKFMQFQAFLGGGKDGGCVADAIGQPFLPPRIEKAPFPAEIAVQVATGGECLNLRAEASKEARVITCLKDGTRLTFLEKPQGGNGPYFGFYPGWALVQTEGKAVGWVNTENKYLQWAS